MNERFNKFAMRARVIPWYIRMGIAAVPITLSLYYWITNSGLYYWLIEIQANIFHNHYYLALTILLNLMIPLIPAALIVQLIVPIFEKKAKENDKNEQKIFTSKDDLV